MLPALLLLLLCEGAEAEVGTDRQTELEEKYISAGLTPWKVDGKSDNVVKFVPSPII